MAATPATAFPARRVRCRSRWWSMKRAWPCGANGVFRAVHLVVVGLSFSGSCTQATQGFRVYWPEVRCGRVYRWSYWSGRSALSYLARRDGLQLVRREVGTWKVVAPDQASYGLGALPSPRLPARVPPSVSGTVRTKKKSLGPSGRGEAMCFCNKHHLHRYLVDPARRQFRWR